MLEKIRKFGLFTKGFIYSLVGVLTLLAALNVGGQVAGKNGVISFLQEQKFGQIIMIIIGSGLLGYAIWRMCSAFLDAKNEGSDKKAYVKRISYFISGLIYSALGLSTLSSSLGNRSSSGSKSSYAATLLEQSWGQIALFLVAAILIGVGVYQFYKGVKKKFLEDINSVGNIESQEILEKSGRFGFIARGISFLIFALFVFRAANQESANQVRGMEGMFSYLQQMPMGNILMALMAVGFIGYGVYQYFLARYSKFYR